MEQAPNIFREVVTGKSIQAGGQECEAFHCYRDGVGVLRINNNHGQIPVKIIHSP
jgi:hypothetical protein